MQAESQLVTIPKARNQLAFLSSLWFELGLGQVHSDREPLPAI